MDFGIWVQNQNMAQGGGLGQSQTDQGQQPSAATPPNGGGSNSGDSGGASPLFSHQMEHPGVVCDACGNGVLGFRYKCLKCADFDLCSLCERRGLHAGHVMMRIPFPEMASEAIKRHMTNIGSPDMRRGFPFGHFDHEREHRHSGVGGHEHRPDHCRGRAHGRRRHSHSSPESADEAKQPWCPYQMGRKEWKKWAKTFKKTAQVHKRSAEAYMQANARGAGTNPETSAETGATTAPPPPQAPFDFTVAASQIQEFLNAFGVPIDVVELYDEWGNRGSPTTQAPQPPQNPTAPTTASGNDVQQTQQGTSQNSTNQEVMTEKFQDLSIRSDVPLDLSCENNDGSNGHGSANLIQLNSGATSSTSQEGEGDAEWTIVDDSENVPRTNAAANSSLDGSTGRPEGQQGDGNTPGVESLPLNRETAVFRQIPIAVEAPPIKTETPAAIPMTTTNIASTPTTATTQPLYPQLQPFVAPLMTGLTNTLENVTRNIPILPWTPLPLRQPQEQPQSIPSVLRQHPPELSEQMIQTLNQLLSMGFSNHNWDLTRLVYAKNGNMEDTLNALFPPSN